MSAAVKEHHTRNNLCTTRAPYRQGRQLKAVKVYTVSQESKYLQVHGVPSFQTETQLVKLFQKYGSVKDWKKMDNYPCEEFTETYVFNFEDIQCARKAKKFLDDRSFYGGILHIHYVPEFETVQDTREKLQQRRKDVARRIRILEREKQETLPRKMETSQITGSDSSSAPNTETSELESDIKLSLEETGSSFTKESHNEHFQTTLTENVPITGHQNQERIPMPPLELPPFPQPPPQPRQPVAIPPPPTYFHNSATTRTFRPHSHMDSGEQFPGHYGVTDTVTRDDYPPWNTPGPPPYPSMAVGAWVGAPRYSQCSQEKTPPSFPIKPPATQEVNHSSEHRKHPLESRQHINQRKQIQTKKNVHQDAASSGIVNENESRNSEIECSVSKGVKATEKSDFVIKDYQPSDKTVTPKFVPRPSALVKKQILPKKLLSTVADSVKTIPASEINPIKALRKRKMDPVNNQLRVNAFILGDVKGPKLPRKEEEVRRDFGKSLSGDSTMETNVVEIRKKVMEFSVKALPPQLKKVKKK